MYGLPVPALHNGNALKTHEFKIDKPLKKKLTYRENHSDGTFAEINLEIMAACLWIDFPNQRMK
ncbi:MAG: hypothetical protein DWQ05_14705 [Calditrichaeota bacterium]|nr:MAG: hypothetical protein DWQ05_14705 [Calditrichota bacterium]